MFEASIALVDVWRLINGTKTLYDMTLKVRVTSGAGAYTALPDWVAVMMQVPLTPAKVTSVPLTPHTPPALNDTCKLDEAVAVIVNGGSLIALFGNELNVIVCGVKFCASYAPMSQPAP